MGRHRRKFKRASGLRDAKLIIIATEGVETEVVYFEKLKEFEHDSKVHVEVLKRVDPSKSAPVHVIKELDKFKNMYQLRKNDELWMVIDVDRWGNKNLKNVAQQCSQKGYYLAVSNPRFELWLLLHFKSLDDYSKEEKDKICNENDYLEKELKIIMGAYNKKIDFEKFYPLLNNAIVNSKKCTILNNDRWPQDCGSTIYLLVEKILTL